MNEEYLDPFNLKWLEDEVFDEEYENHLTDMLLLAQQRKDKLKRIFLIN